MPRFLPNSSAQDGLGWTERIMKHLADKVTLTPESSLDNVVQATTPTAVPLVLKRQSSGATADLLQVQDETGTVLSGFSASGGVLGGSIPVTTGFLSPDLAVGQQLPAPRRYRRLRATPTMVTSFQSGHGFTQTGTGTTNLNDTADFVLRSQAAWISTSGGGVACQLRKTGLTATDFTSKSVVVWLKVDDWSTLSQFQLYMGDTSFANFYIASLGDNNFGTNENQVLKNGEWNRVVIPWAMFSVGGGTPTRSAITDFQFRIVDNSTGPFKLHVNGIGTVPDASTDWPNGVVSITFDDGYANQYTQGRAKMDQYGFPGTAFIIKDALGSSGTYMTLAQAQKLEAYNGWEIAAHSYTLADHNGFFTALSDAALEANLYKMKAWLVANGFRGVDLFAWPGGKYLAAQEAVAAGYFSVRRTINDSRYECVPPSNAGRLLTKMYVTASTTTATITAAIDAAYTNKAWLILVFHGIDDSAQTWPTYSIANFGTVIDYLNTKGIPVRTVGDVMATYA